MPSRCRMINAAAANAPGQPNGRQYANASPAVSSGPNMVSSQYSISVALVA